MEKWKGYERQRLPNQGTSPGVGGTEKNTINLSE
jgi:hypothetical protein